MAAVALCCAAAAVVCALWLAEGGGGGDGDVATAIAASKPRLYGAAWCGHTRRQLQELRPEEVAGVELVDCGRGGCDGVTALPTWEVAGGGRVVGFVPRARLADALRSALDAA